MPSRTEQLAANPHVIVNLPDLLFILTVDEDSDDGEEMEELAQTPMTNPPHANPQIAALLITESAKPGVRIYSEFGEARISITPHELVGKITTEQAINLRRAGAFTNWRDLWSDLCF